MQQATKCGISGSSLTTLGRTNVAHVLEDLVGSPRFLCLGGRHRPDESGWAGYVRPGRATAPARLVGQGGLPHPLRGGRRNFRPLAARRLVPTGAPATLTGPVDPLPWFPIRSSVQDRLPSQAVVTLPSEVESIPVPAVVRLPQDIIVRGGSTGHRVVHQWGLFPASDLSTPVLLSSVGSVTGLGIRPLTWQELAALWDVPILVSDRLSTESDVDLLRSFCLSAPAKVLFVGTDALLTIFFRGGTSFSTFSTTSRSGSDTPGPSPKSDAELGLAGSGGVTAHKSHIHIPVIKGDTQKADGAAVPDHLWVHAFLQGYGCEHHGPRHLRALGLAAGSSVGGLTRPSPPDGWETTASGRATLELFRLFALRLWRRRVLRGFFLWRRRNIRVTKGCSPGQMVHQLLSTKRGMGLPHFAWTTRGRASYSSQWRFIREHPDGQATVRAGHDAIRRSAHASWFEWLEGSAPFFWNWGEDYQKDIRDGQRHFLTGPLPVFLKTQKRHKDPVSHELMRMKVVQVRRRGYVSAGPVVSGTHYFSVPKGLDDIRMVYNGTSCGLNDVLWAPRFGLPTVKQTLQALLPGYLQCDLDVGEQFPNYYLHEELRQYSGVDVREVRSTDPADATWEAERGPGPWERWERNWMGLRDSPYRSLQWQVRLNFEVYGDRRNTDNPFHWDRVEFNLPGSKGYRSDLPWVMKIRSDGHLASEIFVYVDDGRPTGYCSDITWQAARAYGSGCSRRGIQDASRKRTSPTDSPGPWAGTVTRTEGGSLVGLVSQEKWDKTKGLIKELIDMLGTGPLPLQRMLEIRGFLMCERTLG